MSQSAETALRTEPLPQDRNELLIELAIAVQKNAIYPSTHPLLQSAVDGLHKRLQGVLSEIGALSVGVARKQLIIDGSATDEEHPILRELAQRLHRHQIGALRLSEGIDRDELAGFLATVSMDVGRMESPLGLMGPKALQQWRNARLFPLSFDQLELLDESDHPEQQEEGLEREARTHAAQLWIGLASAALAGNSMAEPSKADPELVAKALDEHDNDDVYDQAVVGYMLQIAQTLSADKEQVANALRQRVSRLIRKMQPRTLERLLQMGGNKLQRREFVSNASHVLAADAVVDIVRAASEVSGQTISHSLIRLLNKLARHAESSVGAHEERAGHELREQVHRLISDWQLVDPNPDEYSVALQSIAFASPLATDATQRDAVPAERVLQLSLELGLVGPPTIEALQRMRANGDLAGALQIIEGAPEGAARDQLLGLVVSADLIREVVTTEPINSRLAERLTSRLGAAAVEPLVRSLEGAHERQTNAIGDLLVSLGAVAASEISERIARLKPGVQRPLLQVMDRMPEWPAGFSPAAFLEHVDAGVRREAIRMTLRRAALREAGILAGLRDSDERIVALVLGVAIKSCPPAAVPVLIQRAEDKSLSIELRARGLRALAATGQDDAMRWLVRFAVRRHWLFGTPKLREKSPMLVAAISGLATHWSNASEAKPALALAAQSSDGELRNALTRATAT